MWRSPIFLVFVKYCQRLFIVGSERGMSSLYFRFDVFCLLEDRVLRIGHANTFPQSIEIRDDILFDQTIAVIVYFELDIFWASLKLVSQKLTSCTPFTAVPVFQRERLHLQFVRLLPRIGRSHHAQTTMTTSPRWSRNIVFDWSTGTAKEAYTTSNSACQKHSSQKTGFYPLLITSILPAPTSSSTSSLLVLNFPHSYSPPLLRAAFLPTHSS